MSTGKVINLRRARKSRARDAARQEAAETAALHGRTKGQKAVEDFDKARSQSALDQGKLDTDPAGPADTDP